MKLNKYMSMMLVVMMLPFMVACSSDDDDPVSLESYIVGTWHSFKCSGYGNGQSVDIEITKTGEYSAMYIEATFEKGNKVIVRSWVADKYGYTHWTETTGSYIINGDIVIIKDSNGESADFVFDAKDKTLLQKEMVTTTEGIQVYVNIYYTK